MEAVPNFADVLNWARLWGWGKKGKLNDLALIMTKKKRNALKTTKI